MSRRTRKPTVELPVEEACQVECLHRGAPLHIIGAYNCFVKSETRVHLECWLAHQRHVASITPSIWHPSNTLGDQIIAEAEGWVPCVPIRCPDAVHEDITIRVWSQEEIDAFYAAGRSIFDE